LADRTYVAALFGRHAYGHGAMGTTASLEAISVDDARGFWAGMYGPHAATLIVGGDVTLDVAARAAAEAFDGWQGGPFGGSPTTAPVVVADPRVLLVDRPGAPQSELRLGHVAPSRSTKAYHALVTVNALLGGQFTSRLNRRLREEKGVTYGARTAFDLRRVAGTFSCETSVQADATAGAVADVLEEFADVSRPGAISAHELGRAKASLTRGYVRSYETAGQLVRAAAQLVTQGLPDDTFDRFVPAVEAVTPDAIHAAAREHIRTAEATVVVVGDASQCEESLRALGRPLDFVVPVF
jgi:zinc protease